MVSFYLFSKSFLFEEQYILIILEPQTKRRIVKLNAEMINLNNNPALYFTYEFP